MVPMELGCLLFSRQWFHNDPSLIRLYLKIDSIGQQESPCRD